MRFVKKYIVFKSKIRN